MSTLPYQLHNNIELLCERREYEQALGLAKKDLEKAEEILGKNHPYLTPYLDKIAEIYELQGHHSHARSVYYRTVEIWEETFVPEYNILSDIFRGKRKENERKHRFTYENCLQLTPELHLGTGDNRRCYAHPDNPGLCIKVDKPWNEGFYNSPFKRVKRMVMPWLADFSSNREEARFYRTQSRFLGEKFYVHAPRCHGIALTNLGPGLVFERIRDDDGNYSARLDSYLKEHPRQIKHVIRLIETLYEDMLQLEILIFCWNKENLIVQQKEDNNDRLIVIDWKSEGRPNNDLPIINFSSYLGRRKMYKQFKGLVSDLEQQISQLDYAFV